MYFSVKIKNTSFTNGDLIFEKLKPFLLNGSIILTSNFNYLSSFFTPSPVKHCSFCYIEDEKYFITYISDKGFRIKRAQRYFRNQDIIIVFHYHDLEKMNRSVEFLDKYKNKKYGFFKTEDQYCYKLLYTIYNEVYDNSLDLDGFVRPFNIFRLSFINSNSVFKSKKFISKCALIKDRFIVFKS